MVRANRVRSIPVGHFDTIPAGAPVASTAGARSVLLVDDDAAVSRALKQVLTMAGYDVVAVNDGSTAVEEILSRSFDVILSDIQMPSMSGLDLMRLVRACDLDVPVVLMTGNPSLDTAVEAVEVGALQYLTKPVPNDVLVKVVERASGLHRAAQMRRDSLNPQGNANAQARDRVELQTRFDRALTTMWMAFQPIVDASRQRLFGYEALMRTQETSFAHPGAILETAERLDRLHDLGRRVRALAARAFERASTDALLFVNLHTRDLLDDALYDATSPLTQLARRVVLEITERTAIDVVKDLHRRLRALRAYGFRIAIDDLGSGYAGLSSFVSLEPEIVKIDMSLVSGVHQSAIRQSLIGSMASLCEQMGIQVVAEGVELVEERDHVRRLGCHLLQGYFFAKPGPAFPQPRALA